MSVKAGVLSLAVLADAAFAQFGCAGQCNEGSEATCRTASASEGPKENRGTAEGPKNDVGAPEARKGDMGTPEGPKGLRGAPEGPKGEMGTPEGPKNNLGTPEGPKGNKGAPEGPKQNRDSTVVDTEGGGGRGRAIAPYGDTARGGRRPQAAGTIIGNGSRYA